MLEGTGVSNGAENGGEVLGGLLVELKALAEEMEGHMAHINDSADEAIYAGNTARDAVEEAEGVLTRFNDVLSAVSLGVCDV